MLHNILLEKLAQLSFDLDITSILSIIDDLRDSPEFMDYYDQQTGMILITEVIEKGTFDHIINCLDIIYKLKQLNIFKKFDILEKKLIETTLFHDISKNQPVLSVGQKVFANEVFEDGTIHAEKSAKKAFEKYNISTDTYYTILYHHHEEKELPLNKHTANENWLITYRLFRIIDGLSAALTRSKASIHIGFDSYGIFIDESTSNINYNGTWYHNLYTGLKSKAVSNNNIFSIKLG